jgi:DNA-nicking Smr family endonuclease
MTSDEELFRQQFADVKPLKKNDKAVLSKSSSQDEDRLQKLRDNAVNDGAATSGELSAPSEEVSDDYVERVNPHDVLSFKRPGIQDLVFRKFRLGKYPIEGRLDLHRKKVVQAKNEVRQFIQEGMQYDMRTLLIVHGKGERNLKEQATLKSYVAKWLKEDPRVMAFHSAAAHHGGVGAVYVMLRKSEKAKQETREKLGQR